MHYSIVIPTRGSYHTLLQCLERLADTVPPGEAEVIVVLNGNSLERDLSRGVAEAVRNRVGMHMPMRIMTSMTTGFTAAVNAGAERARGNDLIILNDDTLPGVGWLQNMVAHRAKYEERFPDLKFGAVGPLSNYVIDTQSVAALIDGCTNPANVDQVAALVAKRPPFDGKRIATVLSGFCLMVRASVWKELGGLQTIGKLGGCEDLDFCMRLRDAGYLNLVADNAFVFHHGSLTLNLKDPEGKGGTAYAPLLYKKWRNPRKQKLCIFYRVRITTQADLNLFLASIDESAQYADSIAVFNDNSAGPLRPAVEKQIGERCALLWQDKDPLLPFNEPADRSAALTLARSSGADWLFNLDHDEVIDAGIDGETVFDDLMNPIDPNTTAYSFPIRTLWRGISRVRIDGVWGCMRLPTLFRADASFGGIYPEGNSEFHCSRFPTLMPSDGLRVSSRLMVWHYGYADFDNQARRKYEYYSSRDKVKDPRLIGAADYRHLVDESAVCLAPRKKYNVALAMMAKNNLIELSQAMALYKPFFDAVLVQDNGSTDGLSQFCQDMAVPMITWECCEQWQDPEHLTCDLGAARNNMLDHLRTHTKYDYVFMLDPDERIQARTLLGFDHLFVKAADAYLGTIWNYSVDNGYLEKQHQPSIRLYTLRDERIRYTRALHETIEDQILANRDDYAIAEVFEQLQIDHSGYQTKKDLREKKYAKYEERLKEIVTRDGLVDPAIVFALGVHYNRTERVEEGIDLVATALELKPTFWSARQELIQQHMRAALNLLADIPKGGAPGRGTPGSKYAGDVARALLQFFPDLQASARIDD